MASLNHLVLFLLIGLAAGWLAGQLVKRRGSGWVEDLIVGVIGALIGGFVFGLLGVNVGGLIGDLISATVGAVICKRTVKPVLRGLLRCWVGSILPTQESAHGTSQGPRPRTHLAAAPQAAGHQRPVDPRILPA